MAGPVRYSSMKSMVVLFATIATLMFTAGAIVIGWNARSPENCSGTFACMTANEWGDLLAGISAPIAFVWLVAAVFLQSQELNEQRNELALTRKEFEANRLVMQEQAESLRFQTEAMMQDRATKEFLERIRLLRFWIENNFAEVTEVMGGYTNVDEPYFNREDIGYLTADMPSDPLLYLSSLLTRVGTSLARREMGDRLETLWLKEANPVDIHLLGSKLKQIINMRLQVGPSAVAVLVDADADYILENYPEISNDEISDALLKVADELI